MQRVNSEVTGAQHLIHNGRDTEPKVCHAPQWPEELVTRVFRSFSVSGVSIVNLKIQKKKKKPKLKMFHLKSTHKNQCSCSPNTFYLHKLCHSVGVFFLWEREGKKGIQRRPCTCMQKNAFLHRGCLVVFPFTQQFTGQSVC